MNWKQRLIVIVAGGNIIDIRSEAAETRRTSAEAARSWRMMSAGVTVGGQCNDGRGLLFVE